MTIRFKGSQYPKSVIVHAVFFYVRYAVSYRDLQDILLERGIDVDHTNLNRWVVKYSPLIAIQARQRKAPTSQFWRVDETYVRVKGQWLYQYRAIDKFGKTLDFMLSERRGEAAATAFFKRTIETNGIPDKVVIDKSGANYDGLRNMNILFWLVGFYRFIDILQVKYLNNIIEQDHRFIKKIINPMRGLQSFATASATLDGIETAYMIHKGQLRMGAKSPFEQFAELAG